ncbi:MAG: efflux RND transporter periplasmic adaptor subunit [Gemmatimonadetes bacterium]|nr:efflux RND transporter periplasmic adaptor subunit [Gemmatimonadota bacterium]NIO30759.1 efflux RND transporter periplasmic adaptor subunit [Gemmatimonadota bacterium]
MNRKKLLIAAAGALILLVFVVLAMRQGRRGGTEVRTEEVQRRDLVSVVTASGRIRPYRRVEIQADVSGRIIDLRILEGEWVTEGDTLLIIDQSTYLAAEQRAQAALSSTQATAAQARANRDQARRMFDRTLRIRNQNPELISDQQLEDAETSFEVQEALYQAAEHSVDQARANLREARDRLAKTVITAPLTGRVTRLNVEQGETAIIGTMNNPGTVLATVADLSEMEAVVEVDETDVPQIALGDSADIEIDAFPDDVFTGVVTEIAHSSIQGGTLGFSGTTSDQSVDFEVVIRIDDPPESLRTDLSCTSDIVAEVRDSVLSIPIIALTLRTPEPEEEETAGDTSSEEIELVEEREPQELEGVFVLNDDNTISFRPVTVGVAGREHFEVIEGLEEGEVIVAGSYQAIRTLEEGDLVRPTNENGSSPRGERQ